MVIIKPFRGLRYNHDIIKDCSAVMTPPYDVISPAEQERYYRNHPNNMIRLDLGKEFPEDTEADNRYTRASEFLEEWMKAGILKQEDAPAIYIYDQEFSYGGKHFIRRGFIALVRLEPFDTGSIYPHEQTLPGPKADRLKLMQSCKANLSSIFALFPDEDNAADNYLHSITTTKPEIDFVDDSGVTNKLWVIREKKTIDKLIEIMKGKALFIADGHHRYETSLVYKEQKHKENGGQNRELPSDYVMMVCVSMNNPGLQIFPFHRVVRQIKDFNPDHVLHRLKEFFEIEYMENSGGIDAIMRKLNSDSAPHCFVMYAGQGDRYSLLRLNDKRILEKVFANDHPEWKHLDAGILHSIVLKRILGINSDEAGLKDFIKYVKNETEAVSLVQSGAFQAAFILRPTLIEQVREIALAHKVMPPKSTYFYPKLITGVVINKIN
ncbi:hypothetical protein KsCSTR_39260 [Candidatus Kuenenia stuttgartiensis]|uniref:DUF1015 domain-containing protein n=1 Tax=Kuenenia stuttgartiensis TaxID=174633 RepID=Q1PUL9_KUEST|nr:MULTISPECIES: DUF1015 domain-containing protein [Kuenenia]MBE7548179.1 DUF1015 domain-containing protein [Planctomycetia bacterium]MCF6152596.1 DUF1015 domain-containing protein [Candidatus Kuenenia stuttgartiensis]MCZ7621144.1 DUF1015 domain-containing protein [Candidatus Kuenenia sp.]QII13305.1 hypothetical protein KsCSTR_39260 [Candidatus Kuenenia stuttgartiensis]TVM02368.1 MAG: DUF1015 domain-containing protein [Candidatus Kuenenia stuttgartiensis]